VLKLARRIAECFCVVAVLASCGAQNPASACGFTEYRQVAALLADSSLRVDSSTEAVEQVLRACDDDPMAAYLLGSLPRFAEFAPEKVEEFRRALERAAKNGVAAAAAIHGMWLIDTNQDRDRGAKLVTMAHEADDDWALGFTSASMNARGERLSDAAIARVERLARDGFPLAYSILAAQEMFRISDNRTSYSFEEQAEGLLRARVTAVKGMLRGDSIAVLVANRLNKEFDAESKGFANLADVLNAADPLAFVASHPEETDSAHVAWETTPVFETIDQDTLRLVKVSANACSGSIPSKWKKLCEVRAVVDHYVCMQPFGAYMSESVWMSSSAYRTCRLLRLRVLASAPYY
jgi:hypothetical protein